MNEHVTNTARIIEEKVGEAVSKSDTSNVLIWGVEINSENDFENIDIQQKMTMGQRKPQSVLSFWLLFYNNPPKCHEF